jgi:hypothetical protein
VFPIKAEGTFNLLGSLFLAYTPLKTFLVLGLTTINVIMYAEFDNVIEIDRNRQVLFDYSA